METKAVKAKMRYFRMSPRRMREIADMIRGKSVGSALEILEFSTRKSSLAIKKLLNSAIANAENNFNLDPDSLYVKTIFVDEGPTLKRWIPRAQGRAAKIQKRTSHITVELAENENK
jgi:large subunit ribosomal protein L22